MAQEQIELEFREELMQLQQMQQMATAKSSNSTTNAAHYTKIEARKAILVAEMMEDFMKEEKKSLLNLTMTLLLS